LSSIRNVQVDTQCDKQCPYEATTSTRLNSHVVRSEPRRTQ
jgi:hypothetical protein